MLPTQLSLEELNIHCASACFEKDTDIPQQLLQDAAHTVTPTPTAFRDLPFKQWKADQAIEQTRGPSLAT